LGFRDGSDDDADGSSRASATGEFGREDGLRQRGSSVDKDKDHTALLEEGKEMDETIDEAHYDQEAREPPGVYFDTETLHKQWRFMFLAALVSSVYTFMSYFFPVLYSIPLFTWMGAPLLTEWGWTLTPSFSYVGQGAIMGLRVCISMLAGAIFGWMIIGPLAHELEWCDPVMGWETGCSGWIMWVSLGCMLGESICSLLILICVTGYVKTKNWLEKRARLQAQISVQVDEPVPFDLDEFEEALDPAPPADRVPTWMWAGGIVVSCALCWAIIVPLVGMKFYEPPVALAFAALTTILAVRALGVTDLNPVSGLSKLSQIVFGLVAPGDIVANLVAGGVCEAAAQQAGDLMQDLKVGYLLNASPRAQLYGQLVGTTFSIFVSVGAYALYSAAYGVPSEQFPVPTAYVWLAMAELVNGGQLADNVLWFCIASFVLSGLLPLIAFFRPNLKDWLPSAVSFGIGMYVTPNWTVARFIGSACQFLWFSYHRESHDKYMLVVASGAILGEGLTSILTAIFRIGGVPQHNPN